MPATVHVLARFVAKPGKEEALKSVLAAAVAPSRREIGCYQYDLLVSASEPREYCFIERWDGPAALDHHLQMAHTKKLLSEVENLVESPPDIQRYRLA
jgi:quinol monooxygenase YgiN